MAHGKHAREEKNHNTAAIITTGALSLAGIAAFGGTANAAPEDAWDSIAACESNGVWDLPYGDRDSTGGLQFRVASWNDALDQLRADGIDTSSFPSMPYQATKAQQILAGEALLKLQGPGAWTCNAIQGGPLNGYAGGDYARYIGGGGTPAPAPSTPTPDPDPVQPVPGDSHPSAKDPAPADRPAKWGDDCTHATHTVKPGDTLYGITERHTGNGALDNWEPLYEANRAVVGDNPDLIFPGQVLELPWAGDGAHDDTNGPADPPADPAPEPPANEDPAPPPEAPAGDYAAPLAVMNLGDGLINSGGCVSRSCGGHSGADFSAPEGTPVFAVHSGTAIVNGNAGADYGNYVVINHGDGIYTLYAHLASVSVATGQSVSAGDEIGGVGNTGNSHGAHLHFEVRTDPSQFSAGIFLDPVAWLQGKGIL